MLFRSQHAGESYAAWVEARPANDWARVVPLLERTLDLSVQRAAFFPEFADPMDVFVDASDEGMTAAQVDAVFAELRRELVPLVDAVTAAPAPRMDFLAREYPIPTQLRLGEEIGALYGYDFTRGRQDLTAHPFMTRLGARDVRITTRAQLADPTDALYSTLHEVGHALYEQGVADALLDTPLGGGVSAGVHESQSRLWENLVGRSRAFWAGQFGRFRDAFPEQLSDVTEEEMFRAVNVVRRSLIRTDADELTYNLHVITRYELERQLLGGKDEDDAPAIRSMPMQGQTGVFVNGRQWSAQEVQQHQAMYNQPVTPGQYWYDPISGLYGNWGREPIGYIRPGHPYGNAPMNASNGNTGIFLNGRQINAAELVQWQALFKQVIQPGRYWLDGATGNVGVEGNPSATGNVRAAIQAQRVYR